MSPSIESKLICPRDERIYSDIRIFFLEYQLFEYEYSNFASGIYSNIRDFPSNIHEYFCIKSLTYCLFFAGTGITNDSFKPRSEQVY